MGYNTKNIQKIAEMVSRYDAQGKHYISPKHYTALNNIMFSLLKQAEKNGDVNYSNRYTVRTILTHYEKAQKNLLLDCATYDLQNKTMYVKYIIIDTVNVYHVVKLLELHY